MPQVFGFSFWVDQDQSFDDFFVVPVVIADLIDASFFLQLFDFVLAGFGHVLFGNFRGRNGVVHATVDPNQQTSFASVGGSISQFFFQLDRYIRERAQATGNGHQTVFDIPASGNRSDFFPKLHPLLKRFVFVPDLAVKPCQTQFQIFGDRFATSSNRFVYFDRSVLASDSLVGAGQFRTDIVGSVVHRKDSIQRFFGDCHIATSLLQVGPVQQRLTMIRFQGDHSFDGGFGQFVHSEFAQRLGGQQQDRPACGFIDKILPKHFGLGILSFLQQNLRQTRSPCHFIWLRLNQLAIRLDHLLFVTRFAFHL